MDKEQLKSEQRKARDRVVLAYLDAFDQCDAENVSRILQKAEQDPVLEKMIWDVHATYQTEQEYEGHEKDVALVRELLQRHVSSGWTERSELSDIPPLTVSDVIAQMQSEAVAKGEVRQEFTTLAFQLRQSSKQLPENMGLQGVRKLLQELGVQASKQQQRLFSEAALILISRRDQGMAQLAAARRQRAKALQSAEQPDKEQP